MSRQNDIDQYVIAHGPGKHLNLTKLTELRDLLKEAQVQRQKAATATPLSTGRTETTIIKPPGGISHEAVERKEPAHQFTSESVSTKTKRYRMRAAMRGDAPIDGPLTAFLPLNSVCLYLRLYC